MVVLFMKISAEARVTLVSASVTVPVIWALTVGQISMKKSMNLIKQISGLGQDLKLLKSIQQLTGD